MSKIEVNQISSQCGSTLTIGQSGDTVTLACGATQTGFGRTGTVDWCTTAKTAPFTGVSGKGYFVNTTCGAVTVTLPATPTAGDIISIADYASTWNTNNVTLCNNSSKINGICNNATLNTEGQSITLVYVDATRGWKNTMDSTSNVSGTPNFIVATGGTITCCGDYKIHTFTSDSTFTISSAPTPANNNVDYLVVAGGGGGGINGSGGGGAGGYRESHTVPVSGCYTASPLASATSLPVTVQAYPITVGGGGSGASPAPALQSSGSNSIFSTITSAGGGYGGDQNSCALGGTQYYGSPGGSGGGGRANTSAVGGSGNTPPVSPPQGSNGGGTPSTPNGRGGGGGGATAVGETGTSGVGGATGPGTGAGGNGTTTSISASPTSYSGGGGGGHNGPFSPTAASAGGTGGGGAGGVNDVTGGVAGTANTGGGGGGGSGGSPSAGAAGGSGIVIIRYKYQ